ncbi:pyridoxamine 5'-phosphate oxidase family protein [Actinomadura parmotrematis]|uniref:Pyridoxamine 5'-phosphate oxidase family protein n=1 Tax=Actinomadura parmotrematis TaxID=2864039 RepID=A0ABS7FPI5_9ACTN|nr:pyridoxamine 5'-phosphate oxidase family protein [Actinomadura parmotrematis]MBW8482271.1 pyridoxamine 5'-phosphate oxidase family protein [Actinomadura parmotrematis]
MPPVMTELDRAECFRRISPGGIGRVAFDDGQGPTVVPVNYAVDGETIVLRTTLNGRLDFSLNSHLRGAEVRIAFEVDDITTAKKEGWSVLLRGGAHRMSPEEEATTPSVQPWPGGDKEAHIRLTPNEVTGRCLVQE